MAADKEDREQVLIRLLSLLEDPAGQRIVITAWQPDDALMWIATATCCCPACGAGGVVQGLLRECPASKPANRRGTPEA